MVSLNRKLVSSCLATFVLLGLPISQTVASATETAKSGKAEAGVSIIIDASPKFVWKAVHTERDLDADIAYSKVIQEHGNVKLLEQKFVNIPLLGSVTAVTRQVEDVDHRIDYTLVSSNKFKALEGSWELTPMAGGKKTKLRLQSNLDIGIPFSTFLIKGATQKKMERRLAHVKELAETDQARVAAALNGAL